MMRRGLARGAVFEMSNPSTFEWQRYCLSLGLIKKLEEAPGEVRLPNKLTLTTLMK
jgi:hypothetical protein